MYNDHQGKRWNVYGAKKGSEMLPETQVLDLIKVIYENISFSLEQNDVFSWQRIEKVPQQKQKEGNTVDSGNSELRFVTNFVY